VLVLSSKLRLLYYESSLQYIQGGPKLLVLKGKTWSDFSLDGVIVFAMFENDHFDHFYTTEIAEISAPKVLFLH